MTQNNDEFIAARTVLRLANQIIGQRNHHLRALDLTTEQADSLSYISNHPRITITDLSVAMHVRHQTAQGTVKRLHEKHLVTISENPQDRRQRFLNLTNEGDAALTILRSHGSHTGESILRGMNVIERRNFMALLERAVANLDQA